MAPLKESYGGFMSCNITQQARSLLKKRRDSTAALRQIVLAFSQIPKLGHINCCPSMAQSAPSSEEFMLLVLAAESNRACGRRRAWPLSID